MTEPAVKPAADRRGPTYTLVLRAEPFVANPDRALRQALKVLLRRFGLRAVSVADRAIAKELGVSLDTVNEARDESGGPDGPPEREGRDAGVNRLTPDEVTGRDGKVYRLPVRKAARND